MGTYKCIVNLVPSLVKIDEHSVQNQLERVWIYIPIFQSSFERYSYEKLLLGISKKTGTTYKSQKLMYVIVDYGLG